MALPTFVPGQVLNASDVMLWLQPTAGYKTSDLSRSNTATPSNDPDVTVLLDINAAYAVTYALSYSNASASAIHILWNFTFPAGASGFHLRTYWTGLTTQQTAFPDTWTQARVGFIDNTKDWGAFGQGVVFTGGTSGALALQWSQNTSNATPTILRKGSYIMVQRIG
jgi:hypothetical protein